MQTIAILHPLSMGQTPQQRSVLVRPGGSDGPGVEILCCSRLSLYSFFSSCPALCCPANQYHTTPHHICLQTHQEAGDAHAREHLTHLVSMEVNLAAMPTRWEESFSAVRCLVVLVAWKQTGVLVGWQLSDGVVWGWGGEGEWFRG